MSIDNNAKDFETTVKLFYDECNREDVDFYRLLGVSSVATHKQIQDAYKKYSQEFSQERIENITDPGLRGKAVHVKVRLQHAYEVLIDYDKRAKYEKHGHKEVSEADLKPEDPVERARSHYKMGKSLYEQKAYSMAISALEEAILLDPTRADFLLLLGRIQAKLPELRRKAEQNFQKAIEMEPWNAEHFAAMGLLFYLEKLNHRAESYFKKALQLEPDHVLAKRKLAEIAPQEDKSLLAHLMKFLKKYLPTFFDRGGGGGGK